MILSDLFSELREDFLEDDVEPFKWSDKKLLRYFNEAIEEACYRSYLINDSQTIPVIAGTATYTLDDETREIFLATMTLLDRPLERQTDASLTAYAGSSWRKTTGTPRHYVRKDLTLTLYPIPTDNDTLTVLSYRKPDRLYSKSEEPPIPEAHHRFLLYWAAYKAFLNPDIDLGNTDRALSFLKMFDDHFGPRKSAKFETLSMEQPATMRVIPQRFI